MRAWEEFLSLQEKELGKEIVDKWLRPLKVVRFDACNLYLEAGDSFKALWFEEHLRHKVQHRLFNNNHKHIKVHINVAAHETSETNKKKKDPIPAAVQEFSLKFDELDPQATFDSFIAAPENILAQKLLKEAASTDEKTQPLFNPIYLFGRSGTGKTHLMMATAAALRDAGKRVLYVRADTFTEHVVHAIRAAEMQTFRKAYRNVDALLIDDIEVFSRKNATQEELFHTFNSLHVEGKLIILSAKCPPNELKFIEPRLVSRFEWGIVVPLLMPEKTQLAELLQRRSENIQFPLRDEVKNFLIETFGNNTKSLVRAFEALVLRTHLNQGVAKAASLPLPLKTVQNYLSDLIQEEERSVLTAGKIIKTVAEYYGIRTEDILSKSQSRDCVLPRQIAMHLCREELHLPFMKIGDIFSRDHSTVMTSVKQIQKSIETKNYEIQSSVKSILKLLETKHSV